MSLLASRSPRGRRWSGRARRSVGGDRRRAWGGAVGGPPYRVGRVAVVLFVAFAAGGLGCTTGGGSQSAPPVPTGAGGQADPVLVAGRDVFVKRCASCHGAAGGGGAGPALTGGKLLTDFPLLADQVALVRNGRRGMPAFESKLPAEDIEAVVRYTRDVLTQPPTSARP